MHSTYLENSMKAEKKSKIQNVFLIIANTIEKMTLNLISEKKWRSFGNSQFDLRSLKAKHSSPALVSTAVSTACGKQLVLKDRAASQCVQVRSWTLRIRDTPSGLCKKSASSGRYTCPPAHGTAPGGPGDSMCVFLDRDILGFLDKNAHEVSGITTGYALLGSCLNIHPTISPRHKDPHTPSQAATVSRTVGEKRTENRVAKIN